jgi:outer membrane protein OmpA-like peptidoglycan-associated protein
MRRVLLLLVALPLLLAAAKAAEKSLPAYLTFPPTVHPKDQRALTVEDYGEAEFRQHGSHQTVVQRGKHWTASLILSGAPPKTGGKAAWVLIKPALMQGGWTIADEYDENPFSAIMRYQKDGKDVWGFISVFGAADMRLQLIEVGAPTIAFSAAAPAATPETISDKGDFPYLPPLPDAKLNRTIHDAGPMLLTLPGSGQAQVVATGSVSKEYKEPAGISNLAFVSAYHAALANAGWNIVEEKEGIHQGDSAMTAHYARNGRDIWAYLHRGNGVITIRVGDAGAENLAAQFAKDCHVALYGVLFDFNKATLKPESDSILQRVLAMLQKDAKLKVEVQGHTDNVGGDAYNQKLSEARATSVMAWLTAHGIAPARLSAKGYGETRPVASNDNDEGRAKNRRVEIAKPGCAPAK